MEKGVIKVKGILIILASVIGGSLCFMWLNKKSSLKEGFLDLMEFFLLEQGVKNPINYNLFLTMEEAWLWIEDLKSLLFNSYLKRYFYDEVNGIVSITVEYTFFLHQLQDKPKVEKMKAISKSLAAYFMKYRGVYVNYEEFFFQTFAEGLFTILIPVNQKGLELIRKLQKERKGKIGRR